MTFKKQFIGFLPLSVVVIGLLGYNFLSAQWQNPTATAPGNNTEAPINISANYQAKLGDLGAVRMRAGEYCNADGTICSSDVSGGGGGGGDTITVGGQCFEPAYLVTCNWNWSGDGNDDSTIIYHGTDPTQGCRTMSRVYRFHSVVLAQCAADPVYAWVIGAYSCNAPAPSCGATTNGTNVRTVRCQNQYGEVADDSLCPAPKPATTGTACTRRGSNCGGDR